jgi:hypothetical protein
MKTDTEVLDAIGVRYRQAADEQAALYERSQPDYTVDNEDLLIRFMEDVGKLLSKRRAVDPD